MNARVRAQGFPKNILHLHTARTKPLIISRL